MFKIDKQAVVACGLGHRNDFNTRDELHSKSLQISMSAVVINVGKKDLTVHSRPRLTWRLRLLLSGRGMATMGYSARARSAVDRGTV
jgi:hypothetical protein